MFDAMFATFEGPLLEHLKISHGAFGLLFSLPTLLGVVSAPTASVVLTYGATRVIVIAGIFVFKGCMLIALGVARKNFALVLFGRVVLSLFQSVLGSVASLVTFRLFRSESSRALAYSMIIFSNRVGAISGFFFSGRCLLVSGGQVDEAVWLSSIPTAVCLVATLSFAWLYRGSATARRVRPLMGREDGQRGSSSSASLSGLVRQLPTDFWWLWVLIGCMYGSIIPFETIAVNFFQESYGIDALVAGSVLSICPALALGSPIFSSIVFSAKRQIACVWLAAVSVTCAMLAMLLELPWDVSMFMLLLGLGYMMATNTVWVLVPQVVTEPQLQTVAIGVSGVSSSLFIAAANFLAGYLRDWSGSWRYVLVLFTCIASLGVISATSLAVGLMKGRWGREEQPSDGTLQAQQVDVVVTRLNQSGGLEESHFATNKITSSTN